MAKAEEADARSRGDDWPMGGMGGALLRPREKPKAVVKERLSEDFLFTIEGREDIKDKEPKRLVAMKVAEVPLESVYKLSDRAEGNVHQVLPLQKHQAAGCEGQGEEALGDGEPMPVAPAQRHGAGVFGICEQRPGLCRRDGNEICARRRPRRSQRRRRQGHHHPSPLERPEDQQHCGAAIQAAARRSIRHYYDLVDDDETFYYEEEVVSGKPAAAKTEVERQFDADVALGAGRSARRLDEQSPGPMSICTRSPAAWNGSISSMSKYFLDLQPGKKQLVQYSVTYTRRKVGPELNTRRSGSRVVSFPRSAWTH